MSHEFDRSRWIGWSEPDHVSYSPPGDSRSGEMVADWIDGLLKENGTSLPDDAKYLGLAVGQAYPELKFAELLKIKPGNITLVDKRFHQETRLRFENEYPEVQIVTSGMFEFLDNPPERDYSLLTALGIEYALEESTVVESFISQLSTVMRPGGIVTIFPYTGEDPTEWWDESGFKPLCDKYTTYHGWASNLIYVFNGNTPAE